MTRKKKWKKGKWSVKIAGYTILSGSFLYTMKVDLSKAYLDVLGIHIPLSMIPYIIMFFGLTLIVISLRR